MPRIYVAGPILNGHTLPLEEGIKNVNKAFLVGYELMKKGWSPFIPQGSLYMSMYLKKETGVFPSWETWMALDSAYISVCQALFYIGSSKGANRELDWAKEHGLIIYYKLEDVPEVKPDTSLLNYKESKKV